MEEDYYKILGVKKNASENDIKKEYYKLARLYHPDKAPADKKDEYTQKFQKIGEAYEVLSDKEKRDIYDSVGKEGLQGGMKTGMNPFDIFGDLFGNNPGNPFSNFGNPFSRTKKGPSKNKETIYNLSVSLKDIYNGAKKKLKISKKVIIFKETKEIVDDHLESTWIKCNKCFGQGFAMDIRQFGNMMTQSQKPCSNCQTSGYELKDDYDLADHTETLEIEIPKGIQNGYHKIIPDAGNYSPGSLPGDLIIVFQVKDSYENFTRGDNNNLIYKKNILLSEALTGFSFTIDTMDSRTLFITSSNIIRPGDVRMIKGEGLTKGSDKGNLIVQFKIIFPDSLPGNKKKELLKILPINENPDKKTGDAYYQI